MTANLTARGRKLVTIVDPHIKRDSNYFFYKENHDRDLFVHTKDGGEFDGKKLMTSHFLVKFISWKMKHMLCLSANHITVLIDMGRKAKILKKYESKQ